MQVGTCPTRNFATLGLPVTLFPFYPFLRGGLKTSATIVFVGAQRVVPIPLLAGEGYRVRLERGFRHFCGILHIAKEVGLYLEKVLRLSLRRVVSEDSLRFSVGANL